MIEIKRANLNCLGEIHIDKISWRIIKNPKQVCGRSTLNMNYKGVAIYFNRNTEFDRIMLEELKKYYKTIIIIDSKFEDDILDDYQMLIQSMYLTKYIAEKKEKDLSKVDYSPIVKRLYKYNGNI